MRSSRGQDCGRMWKENKESIRNEEPFYGHLTLNQVILIKVQTIQFSISTLLVGWFLCLMAYQLFLGYLMQSHSPREQ